MLRDSRDTLYRLNLQTGWFEYISPSVESELGYTAEELLGMGPRDICAEPEIAALAERL